MCPAQMSPHPCRLATEVLPRNIHRLWAPQIKVFKMKPLASFQTCCPSFPVLQLVNSRGARNQGKICPWPCFLQIQLSETCSCIFWNIFHLCPLCSSHQYPGWMLIASSGGTSVASQLISSDCSSSSSAPQRPTTTTPLLTAATVCCLKPKSACIPSSSPGYSYLPHVQDQGHLLRKNPLVPATTRAD